ncbi:hypothetical protein [Anaerosalibacter massiliensis]|uniref:Uncharacterized protein n=1 Tax=Anaerosalibacter massiliensis TaxID=1347392 RepID=A0A9X2S3F9_9FIRM|nr:hypothetical protein [Anaerosalibacter massiliensis]MCR2042675.1 hypothetical protein [Anaerosalibacter massiliensis]
MQEAVKRAERIWSRLGKFYINIINKILKLSCSHKQYLNRMENQGFITMA